MLRTLKNLMGWCCIHSAAMVCVVSVMMCCWCGGAAIAQSDDQNSALEVRTRVFLESPLPLTVHVLRANTVLQLLSVGTGTTTQVHVVIHTTDPTADITMTFSVDNADRVPVPDAPIMITADGNTIRHIRQFELSAERVGTAIVWITVTNGTHIATAALPIVVIDPITVIEPQTNTVLRLLSSGTKATTPVQVVIDSADTTAELTLTVSTDDADVVSVPNAPITIAADGNAMRRTTQFELTAREAGEAMLSLAVSDGTNTDTVALRVVVTDPHLQILSPLDNIRLLSSELFSRGAEVTTQVQVVIDFEDTISELTLTVSVDDTDMVSVPSAPITIAADDSNTRQRSAQFELTAREAGEAMLSLAVTDGRNTVTVSLRVIVEEPPALQIISPLDDASYELVRGDGTAATSQVMVVIIQRHTELPVTLSLQLDSATRSPVFISTTSLILSAPDDGRIQRMAEFTLLSAEAGDAMLTLIATDSMGNRDAVTVRATVLSTSEVCESCLVPDTVIVSSGTFIMGSPVDEPGRDSYESSQHRVTIDYAMEVGKYEVTRGQYRVFVETTGFDAGTGTGSWLNAVGFTQTDAHPVIYVNWVDAQAYLRWLSTITDQEWRLLSEAEWEYVARAGTTTTYYVGTTIDETQARFNSSTGTVAVGSYPANPFGVHDIYGNVWEWIEDCWHFGYDGAPTDGSAWVTDCEDINPPLDYRPVRRGGTWSDPARRLRSAYRIWGGTDDRFPSTDKRVSRRGGFRIVRTLNP